MRYKVGDKVKVRDNLSRNISAVVSDMLRYKGEVFTIDAVSNDGHYYKVNENDWCWTDEMLEPVSTDKPKFKVGDRVKVKNGVYSHKLYDGKRFEIKRYDNNDGTYLCTDIDVGYSAWLVEEALEPAYQDGGFCNGFRGGKIAYSKDGAPFVEIPTPNGFPDGVSIHDVPLSELYNPVLVCNEIMAKDIAERLEQELKKTATVSFVNGSSITAIPKEEKKMSVKFKIGDKVRVLDGSHIPNYTGNWNELMNYKIRFLTIKEVYHFPDGRTAYYVEENDYMYDERGLEPVDSSAYGIISEMCDRLGDEIERLVKEVMKNSFIVVEGERIDKTCNQKVKTVTTYAYGENSICCATTCDEKDYDAYTGALVAAAKITASKSEEAGLMYNLAMKYWSNNKMGVIDSNTITILQTLADRAFCGKFENSYKRWQKQLTQAEKWAKSESLKCKVCGETFDTEEKARAHEQWHIDNKRKKYEDYLIRKEAKRRMAENEKEQKINAAIQKIAKENK